MKAGTAIKIGAGAGIAAGIGLIGYGAYTVITGGVQAPACTTLQNELKQVMAKQFAIYNQVASSQNGTFTQGQQSAINTYQQEQASLLKQIATTCTVSPAQTLEQYLNKIIVYASWEAMAILAAVGIYFGISMIRWISRRIGSSSSDPGTAPESVDDAAPASSMEIGKVNMDIGTGRVIQNASDGTITPSEASRALTNLTETDAVGVDSGAISDFYRALAQTFASEETDLIALFEGQAEIYSEIATLDAEETSLAADEIAAL